MIALTPTTRSATLRGMSRLRVVQLLVLLALPGCLTVTGTLRPDDSGTFVYRYFPPKHATFRSERVRLASEHVRVEDIEAGAQHASATLTFDDVTKLSTATAFADVQVERRRDGEVEVLRLVLPGMPENLRRATLAAPPEGPKNRGPEIELTVPGDVVEASPPATVTARTVRWSLTLTEFARLDSWELSVRWQRPPAS